MEAEADLAAQESLRRVLLLAQPRRAPRCPIPRTRRHTVAAGETGFGIAYRYGVPWRSIATANGMGIDDAVRTGQNLLIPTVIAPASQGTAPAAVPAPTPATTPAASPAAAPARPSLSVLDDPPARLAWPVSGSVRRAFAPRGRSGYHDGIDIRTPEGTAVRASAAGRVIFAGQGPREYGLTVIIHHGQRWTTVYGFLGRITVKEGDRVKAGERVGLVGRTGLSKGDELHFEVRRSREALNPASYLPDAG